MLLNKDNKGLIIVISAPSGAGKTSICRKLLLTTPNLIHSISFTTRKPREKEKNAEDYFFVAEEEFKKRLEQNEFVEWAEVHENLYGTPKKFLEDTINSNIDVILDIDVVGALKVKKEYPDSILIFILPPSKEILEDRLRKRNTDNEKVIEKRLINAEKELKFIKKYDYVIENINLDEAVDNVKAIIKAEKFKINRKEIDSYVT